MQELRR